MNLTLPGLGGGGSASAPPPPAAPPPPPTQVDARRQMATRGGMQNAGSTYGANVRNEGGARGIDVSSTMRALKSLTGQ